MNENWYRLYCTKILVSKAIEYFSVNKFIQSIKFIIQPYSTITYEFELSSSYSSNLRRFIGSKTFLRKMDSELSLEFSRI